MLDRMYYIMYMVFAKYAIGKWQSREDYARDNYAFVLTYYIIWILFIVVLAGIRHIGLSSLNKYAAAGLLLITSAICYKLIRRTLTLERVENIKQRYNDKITKKAAWVYYVIICFFCLPLCTFFSQSIAQFIENIVF